MNDALMRQNGGIIGAEKAMQVKILGNYSPAREEKCAIIEGS